MKTQLNVFLSPYSIATPEDLASGDPERIGFLVYSPAESFADGYTKVGTAECEVTLLTNLDLIESKRQALEAQLNHEIAEAQRRQNILRDQIQNLLALPSGVAE